MTITSAQFFEVHWYEEKYMWLKPLDHKHKIKIPVSHSGLSPELQNQVDDLEEGDVIKAKLVSVSPNNLEWELHSIITKR